MTIEEKIARMQQQGKSVAEIAKAVTAMNQTKFRKNAVEAARGRLRIKLFEKSGIKRTKAEQVGLMYEFMRVKKSEFQNWLQEKESSVLTQ